MTSTPEPTPTPDPQDQAAHRNIAARTTVLRTYELLEKILLHLPLCDLLFAECLSTTFRSVILRSLMIKRALFRTSIHHDAERLRYGRYGLSDEFWGWRTADGKPYRLIINLFMNKYLLPPTNDSPQGKCAILHFGFVDPHGTEHLVTKGRMDSNVLAFCSRKASWRQMLVFQPAVKAIDIVCADDKGCCGSGGDFALEVDKGEVMTLGRFRAALYEHWLDCPNSPFGYIPGNVLARKIWHYHGDGDVERIDLGCSGWEVLAHLGKCANLDALESDSEEEET